MDQTILNEYIASLDDKALQAYHIAKSHLGSSFSLERSAGFKEWLKARETLTTRDS